jgi:hypothetical protein
MSSANPDVLYVFLLFPKSQGQTEGEYREERQNALDAYCLVAKYKFKTPKFIVGIATEPGPPGTQRSEDIASYDVTDFAEEDAAAAAVLQREHNIFMDYKRLKPADYYRSRWPEPMNRKERRARLAASRKSRR